MKGDLFSLFLAQKLPKRGIISYKSWGFMNDSTITLSLNSQSKKGFSQGTVQKNSTEKQVLVQAGLPGEVVRAEIIGKKKKQLVGKLLSIMTPSKDRVEPRCSHADLCGGCVWQHLNYDKQLETKQTVVEDLFEPFNVLEKVKTIIPSKKLFGYRNKMEFTFSEDKQGKKYLGLIEALTKGLVINLKECHLVSPWQSRVLNNVREFWEKSGLSAYKGFKDEGTLQTLTLREGQTTGDKLVMLQISSDPRYAMTRSQIDRFKQGVLKVTGEEVSIFLRLKKIEKGRSTEYFEMHLHGKDTILETLQIPYCSSVKTFDFAISPASFFQPNTSQAETLFSKALELTSCSQGRLVFDLYSGTGTLGLIFSSLAKKVYSIEINPYGICDGQENAKRNKVTNIEFIKGDVGEELEKLKNRQEYERPGLVLLDPPRSGLTPKAIEQVINLNSEEILYISCNPYTQVEDIKLLVAAGYQIQTIQPIDQFPHTVHIENIALLKKKAD